MRKEDIFDDCSFGHLPIGLFRLEKSYDQILADHNLIRQMKKIIEELGSHYNFEVMIKEAYFRCGIILIRPCVHDFYDYIKIMRKSRPVELEDEYGILERIVTCMTHLLLSTRKCNSNGTASILDELKRKCIDFRYAWQPENPFKKLLDLKKPHNIDFGVRALPLDAEEWYMANWYQVVLANLENDIDSFDKYSPAPNWFDESAFHIELVKRVLELIDVLGFKTQSEQMNFLDLITDAIMYPGCGYPRPECKGVYGNLCPSCSERDDDYFYEATYCNPLLEKAYNEVKSIIKSRFKKTKSNAKEEQVMNDIINAGLLVEESDVDMSKTLLEQNVHESVKKCFKFPNVFVRQQVEAIVKDFYLGQNVNLAMIEVALYDHGQLKKRNEHTAFVRALKDWGILSTNVNIAKAANGMATKFKSFPLEGYKKWDNNLLNERNLCANIGNRLPVSMKYNR